jgi:hypothetical protein
MLNIFSELLQILVVIYLALERLSLRDLSLELLLSEDLSGDLLLQVIVMELQ